MRKEVTAKAELAAEERVIEALVGAGASDGTRQQFRKMLREGKLDEKEIAAFRLPVTEQTHHG